MTIVPNVAQQASKVTMLQRSPTHVVARPDQMLSRISRKWLPSKLAYSITRPKIRGSKVLCTNGCVLSRKRQKKPIGMTRPH